MSVDSNEIIAELDTQASKRLRLEVRRETIKAQHESERRQLAERQAAELAPLEDSIRVLDGALHDMVMRHRGTVLQPGKRSFALHSAVVSLRKVPAKVKITDSEGIMEVARRRGFIRKIGRPIRKYVLSPDKFLSFLSQCDEHRLELESYIDEVPEHDSLSIRPNDQHETTYDGRRLTTRSITIHPSSPRA